MNNNPYKQILYQIVPELYRNRDTGDLEKFFTGSGYLLDQIYATLVQRHADSFPDNPLDGSPSCQEWLLPYFADLLDVRLVSPSVKGRRDEVANAVRWRQGKGTLRVVEEIAEAVGKLEVVLHEGWRRVATTPRLNVPLVPASSYGYSGDLTAEPPWLAARHPGLPAVTVDFRFPSGAIASDSSNPGAQQSTVDGDTHVWRQASFHGAPCHPDSYEDVSRRTLDFRCADWRVGHYHPKKTLLYTVPPAGFFRPGLNGTSWPVPPSPGEEPNPFSNTFQEYIEVKTVGNTTIFRNKTFGAGHFVPVRVNRILQLPETFDGPANHTWIFQGLILNNNVQLNSGQVHLDTCAIRSLEIAGSDVDNPVIDARNSLFNSLHAARNRVRLEYCTVLEELFAEALEASDCIFMGAIHKESGSLLPPESGCIRYSRIVKDQPLNGMQSAEVTRRSPVMYATEFGSRGCGVLHPATPKAIRQRAEDGSEMGAFHQDHLSLLADAVADKLADYMPVGLGAVVIPDPRLIDMPG